MQEEEEEEAEEEREVSEVILSRRRCLILICFSRGVRLNAILKDLNLTQKPQDEYIPFHHDGLMRFFAAHLPTLSPSSLETAWET